ncbi:MAG: DUF6263 family protein, partial [Planctomycetota bacterium]
MYSNKKIVFGFVLSLAFVLIGSNAMGEEAKFRYKFNKGDVIIYKLINSQVNEQMGMKIESEQIQYMKNKVLSMEGDVATLEMTITRILFSGKNPMQGETSYDSAAEDQSADPNMEMYKMMIDKPFTMKMNTRGKIVAVSGYSELAKSMIKKVTGESGGDPQAQMRIKMMESMFSDETMAKIMSQSSTCFPEGPVKTGEGWNETSALNIPMIGDLVTNVKNTFEAVEKDIAKVKVTGTLEMKPVEAEAESAADPQDP